MGTPRIDRIDPNLLINADLRYWQRTTSLTINGTGAASGFSADRFAASVEAGSGGTKNFTVSRNADVPLLTEAGYLAPYSMNIQANATLTTGNEAVIWGRQRIELALVDSAHRGKELIYGFWYKTNKQGTHSLYALTNTSSRLFVQTISISAGELNTWVFRAIRLPNDWVNFGAATYLEVGHHAMGNGTFLGAATGSWSTYSSGAYVASGSVNLFDSTSNYARIAMPRVYSTTNTSSTAVSLVPATRFSLATENSAEELQLCQRYYEKSADIDAAPNATSVAGDMLYFVPVIFAGTTFCTVKFCVAKRATPTLYSWSPATGAGGTGTGNSKARESVGTDRNIRLVNAGVGSYCAQYTNADNGGNNVGASSLLEWHWAADAEL